MDVLQETLALKKTTKNKVRFDAIEPEEAMVSSIYIAKEAFSGAAFPESITITVSVEGTLKTAGK